MKEKIISSLGSLISSMPRPASDLVWKKRNLTFSRSPDKYPFQIMIYHRVLEKPDPFAMAPVMKHVFEEQLKLYSKNYRVIGLSRLLDEIQAGFVPPRTLCITFDDGYTDNFKIALPLLKKYGLPATVFVATQAVDEQKPLWYDSVLEMFSQAGKTIFSFELFSVINAEIKNISARREIAHKVLGHLKNYHPIKRDELIAEISAELKTEVPQKTSLMLNWDEVIKLKENGVDIGAHTHTHPILSKLKYEEAKHEISSSKKILEDKLQEDIALFAYPNGSLDDYNGSSLKAAADSGIKLAVTTTHGTNNCSSPLLELNRRQTWEDDPHSLFFRLLSDCARAN